MRIGDVILKKETIDLMAQDHLTPEQFQIFNRPRPGYSYGLGVRTAVPGIKLKDFGWGGANGSFLAIDRVNQITVFYVQHVLTAPIGPYKNKLYEYLLDDLGL